MSNIFDSAGLSKCRLTQLHSAFDMRLRRVHLPRALRGGRVRGVRLRARRVDREAPDKVDVALARLVQLGVLAQALVVDGQRHHLGLLQLEPVDRHLQNQDGGRLSKASTPIRRFCCCFFFFKTLDSRP